MPISSEGVATLYISNGLNQAVAVTIKGNRVNSYTGAVDIGTAINVSASSFSAKTLAPALNTTLPYLTVNLKCTTAPTTGTITVYLLSPKAGEVVVVNSLAIRDTNDHNPTTDSAISIVEWW